MIFNRIELINHQVDKHAQFRLNHKKKFMDYEINGLCKEILDEWIFKHDGETNNGQTINFQFKTNSWTTGKNAAPWLYWQIVNKGIPKNYMVDNTKHRIQGLEIRSVGIGFFKAKVYRDFNFKNANGEWVPLGKC